MTDADAGAARGRYRAGHSHGMRTLDIEHILLPLRWAILTAYYRAGTITGGADESHDGSPC